MRSSPPVPGWVSPFASLVGGPSSGGSVASGAVTAIGSAAKTSSDGDADGGKSADTLPDTDRAMFFGLSQIVEAASSSSAAPADHRSTIGSSPPHATEHTAMAALTTHDATSPRDVGPTLSAGGVSYVSVLPSSPFPKSRVDSVQAVQGQAHPRVKIRVKLACTNCKASKTKCDDERPCRRCARTDRSHTCTDSALDRDEADSLPEETTVKRRTSSAHEQTHQHQHAQRAQHVQQQPPQQQSQASSQRYQTAKTPTAAFVHQSQTASQMLTQNNYLMPKLPMPTMAPMQPPSGFSLYPPPVSGSSSMSWHAPASAPSSMAFSGQPNSMSMAPIHSMLNKPIAHIMQSANSSAQSHQMAHLQAFAQSQPMPLCFLAQPPGQPPTAQYQLQQQPPHQSPHHQSPHSKMVNLLEHLDDRPTKKVKCEDGALGLGGGVGEPGLTQPKSPGLTGSSISKSLTNLASSSPMTPIGRQFLETLVSVGLPHLHAWIAHLQSQVEAHAKAPSTAEPSAAGAQSQAGQTAEVSSDRLVLSLKRIEWLKSFFRFLHGQQSGASTAPASQEQPAAMPKHLYSQLQLGVLILPLGTKDNHDQHVAPWVNHSLAQLLGYQQTTQLEQLLGTIDGLASINHPSNLLVQIPNFIDSVMQGATSYSTKSKWKHTGGHWIEVLESLNLAYHPTEGHVEYVASLMQVIQNPASPPGAHTPGAPSYGPSVMLTMVQSGLANGPTLQSMAQAHGTYMGNGSGPAPIMQQHPSAFQPPPSFTYSQMYGPGPGPSPYGMASFSGQQHPSAAGYNPSSLAQGSNFYFPTMQQQPQAPQGLGQAGPLTMPSPTSSPTTVDYSTYPASSSSASSSSSAASSSASASLLCKPTSEVGTSSISTE